MKTRGVQFTKKVHTEIDWKVSVLDYCQSKSQFVVSKFWLSKCWRLADFIVYCLRLHSVGIAPVPDEVIDTDLTNVW